MKKKIVFFVLISLMTFCYQAKSQDFEIPKGYVLNTKDDFVKYEKDIISCANWMENTPLDKDEKKRTDANSFLVSWLTGTTTVNINLNTDMTSKYFDQNPQFQIIFMSGWTRYALQNNYCDDQQKGYYEGYKSVINVYKKGINIKKNKELEKLIAIYDKGELENWIKENLKK